MHNKLAVGQIFLPNIKRASSYVSIYEEVIRSDQSVTLFLVLEIRGDRKSPATKKREEFDALTQSIARALKNTYLSESRVSEQTFEKALSTVNAELSNLAHRGVVGWYKKLNALIGAFHKNTLSVSVAGSANAFLLRGKEFTDIAADLSSGDKPHPLKTFVNFASGDLSEGDNIILSTPAFFNYISLQKLRLILHEQTLDEATRELIAQLKTDPPADEAFCTFIAQAHTRLRFDDSELQSLIEPASHSIIEDTNELESAGLKRLSQTLKRTAGAAGSAVGSLFSRARGDYPSDPRTSPAAGRSNSRKPIVTKKSFLYVFGFVVCLLLISLISLNFYNSQQKTKSELQAALNGIAKNLTDTEAAMIYGDETRALEHLAEAAKNFSDIAGNELLPDETKKLSERITKLTNQLNKINPISQQDQIAQFSATPDRLIKTPSGFVGFNSVSDAFEIFTDSNRSVAAVKLTSPVSENLVAAAFGGNPAGVNFIADSGTFYSLASDGSALSRLSTTSTVATDTSHLGLEFYGGRAYSIDTKGSQIKRFGTADTGFGGGQNWLKQNVDFGAARSFAVDGAIWVLFSDTIKKYVRGVEEPFSVPQLLVPMKDPVRLYTQTDFQYLYVADPANRRIVVLTKDGGLAVQLTADSFSDLKDIWVDEGGKMIYALIGANLVRFKY